VRVLRLVRTFLNCNSNAFGRRFNKSMPMLFGTSTFVRPAMLVTDHSFATLNV